MWLISCTYYHCTLFCSDWMMYSVVSLSSRSLTNPPLIAGISIHIKIDSSSVLGLMSFIMLSYDIIASFDCSTLLRAAIYLLWLSIVISGISFDSWNLKSIFLTCWIFGSISWRDWIILSKDIFLLAMHGQESILFFIRGMPKIHHPRSSYGCVWLPVSNCPCPYLSVYQSFLNEVTRPRSNDSHWACWPSNNRSHAGLLWFINSSQ